MSQKAAHGTPSGDEDGHPPGFGAIMACGAVPIDLPDRADVCTITFEVVNVLLVVVVWRGRKRWQSGLSPNGSLENRWSDRYGRTSAATDRHQQDGDKCKHEREQRPHSWVAGLPQHLAG